MSESTTQVSSSLAALLRFAKRNINSSLNWRDVAEALAPTYGHKMTLEDVMIVLLREINEAVNEKRFQLGSAEMLSRRIIMAPVKGHFAMEFLGVHDLDGKYAVEDFYNAMVRTIISELRCTRVDWCRAEVFGDEAVPA